MYFCSGVYHSLSYKIYTYQIKCLSTFRFRTIVRGLDLSVSIYKLHISTNYVSYLNSTISFPDGLQVGSQITDILSLEHDSSK